MPGPRWAAIYCSWFKGYFRHGTAGLWAGDVLQPSRRVSGQCLLERALEASSLISFGGHQVIGGDGSIASHMVMANSRVEGQVTPRPPCPSITV